MIRDIVWKAVAEVTFDPAEERSALDGLMTFLRDNPKALNDPAETIAEEFGLPVEFVDTVLISLRGPEHEVSLAEQVWSVFKRVGVRASEVAIWVWEKTSKWLRATTERPFVFLLVTMLILPVAMRSVSWISGSGLPMAGILVWFFITTVLFLFALQLVCYFRHGRIRYPLMGSGMLLVVLLVMFLSGVGSATSTTDAPVVIIQIVAALMLSVIYLMFGGASSIAGGILRVSRENRQERKLTRQELVGRLLEIEQKLKNVSASELGKVKADNMVARARATHWFPLFALGAGVCLGIFEVAVLGSYNQITGEVPIMLTPSESPQMSVLVIMMTTFFVTMTLYGVVGYLAGRFWRSLLSLLLCWGGHILPNYIPYGHYGPEYVGMIMGDGRLIQSLGFVVVIAILASIGASIDLNQRRKQNLRTNDPAQLVAEAVQLQWRLNLGRRAACVMSVDVAGSTKMKSNGDPLRIEYSFREYQQMVEEISQRHGGHVFSTAGDGAIVAFPECRLALDAARDIQSEMPSFNQRRNRLDTPFRVRVGLHTGETQAEFGDAPFNELIDIAAHVEKVAPVGGIAVSGQVAEKLPGVRLAEMAQAIDDQHVFIDMDPTRPV